jgi:hypothetical protein
MKRRDFLSVTGGMIAGASLAAVAAACAGDTAGVTPPSPEKGSVKGTVVDANGTPQPIGRIFLLQKSGLNVGVYADVDATGRFDFGPVNAGEYQLSYWGSNRASVPEEFPNPRSVTVSAAAPVSETFQIVISSPGLYGGDVDIYAGDYFFQEQPSGAPNGTVVVKLGTSVCWYNVGAMPHTVTGGPWKDSGPLGHADNFIWVADTVGTFPYRCTFHGAQMLATLQVVP